MALRKQRIRVLCVDDHRIVREGIALIIGREPDMEVVASAATGEEAVRLFERHQPDVTLMDLQLGAMSGVDAIRAIRLTAPEARVVVLTMYQGDEDIHRALEAGRSRIC
jgi:DNA-binding NarL/FixJ family response regulator